MQPRKGKRVCSVTCRVRKMEAFRYFERTVRALMVANEFTNDPMPFQSAASRERWAIRFKSRNVTPELNRAFHYWRWDKDERYRERYQDMDERYRVRYPPIAPLQKDINLM